MPFYSLNVHLEDTVAMTVFASFNLSCLQVYTDSFQPAQDCSIKSCRQNNSNSDYKDKGINYSTTILVIPNMKIRSKNKASVINSCHFNDLQFSDLRLYSFFVFFGNDRYICIK